MSLNLYHHPNSSNRKVRQQALYQEWVLHILSDRKTQRHRTLYWSLTCSFTKVDCELRATKCVLMHARKRTSQCTTGKTCLLFRSTLGSGLCIRKQTYTPICKLKCATLMCLSWVAINSCQCSGRRAIRLRSRLID